WGKKGRQATLRWPDFEGQQQLPVCFNPSTVEPFRKIFDTVSSQDAIERIGGGWSLLIVSFLHVCPSPGGEMHTGPHQCTWRVGSAPVLHKRFPYMVCFPHAACAWSYVQPCG